MNRKSLESTCTSLAVFTLGILVVLTICAVFDQVLNWDLLSGLMEKVAALVFISLAVLLGACVLVSIMLNISIIAEKVSDFVEGMEDSYE